MTDEHDDDALLLDQEEPQDDDDQEQDDASQDSADDSGDDDDDMVVTIGDDDAEPGEEPSDLVKHLRNELKEARKREKALSEAARPAPQAIDPGPRPTLAAHDYDEEAFEAALDTWKDAKAGVTTAERDAAAARARADTEWQATLATYATKKAALARPDMQDAEDTVVAEIDTVRQAIIARCADDPAKVIYALGKHPAKLAELAKITDPDRFAFAVAKLEGSIKMTTRRKAPDPEQVTRGSAPLAAKSADKVLDAMYAAAAKTGDYSKVAAHAAKNRDK